MKAMHRTILNFAWVIPTFILAGTLGCGDGRPSRVPISGQVLIDGQPLKYGSVRFVPAHGRMSSAMLDSNGRFSLNCFDTNDGAIIGTHQVSVAASEQISPTKVRWYAPKKYADFTTSGLIHEVTGNEDAVVINLSWDGGQPFDETIESDDKTPGN